MLGVLQCGIKKALPKASRKPRHKYSENGFFLYIFVGRKIIDNQINENTILLLVVVVLPRILFFVLVILLIIMKYIKFLEYYAFICFRRRVSMT